LIVGLIDAVRHVLSVGGPSVSLAVKRSTDTNGHDVIKRPALKSVSHDTLQVCLPVFMYAAFVFILCHPGASCLSMCCDIYICLV